MKHFPFPSIVGLELAKRSLIYHAIDPRLGGTLLLGHRGCAKSTLARAFAAILPLHGDGSVAPFIEVPLGATDDRLLGSVDAGSVLEEGRWRARRGLIEQAHGGVLYIDEINLLPDHLADFILDSAATGQYRMERDGLTKAVESRYILIGSMNPDEGDLRPQLTDRFAHGVIIRDDYSAEERVEIVKRRMEFDDGGGDVPAAVDAAGRELQAGIEKARMLLKAVVIDESHRAAVGERARELRLEGVRAEIAVLRTARAAAAWDKRNTVNETDIEEAWILCLGHRMSETLPDPPPPRPTNPETDHRKSRASSSSAQFPIAANPEPQKVDRTDPIQHPAFSNWWCKQSLPVRGGNSSRHTAGSESDTGRRIAWIGSLVSSLRDGWKPGGRGWRLRYESSVKKPAVWIFIDASRSSGAQQFLGLVSSVIRGAAERACSTRFHLLVLRDGRTRWIARNATSKRVSAELGLLVLASGKSFLAEGVTLLRRAMIRKSASDSDRALVCTDGFVSPHADQTAQQAVATFQESLRRLCMSGVRIAWLHPKMQRGMRGWVDRLRGSLPIAKIEINSR